MNNHYEGMPWADMTPDQRRIRVLDNEARAYRKAIAALICIGEPGRKTVPIDKVRDIATRAHEAGNLWSRKYREIDS